jgi:hypothetical protein
MLVAGRTGLWVFCHVVGHHLRIRTWSVSDCRLASVKVIFNKNLVARKIRSSRYDSDDVNVFFFTYRTWNSTLTDLINNNIQFICTYLSLHRLSVWLASLFPFILNESFLASDVNSLFFFIVSVNGTIGYEIINKYRKIDYYKNPKPNRSRKLNVV